MENCVCNINGYPIKGKACPSLPEDMKTQLKNLATAYQNDRSKYMYDGAAIRNIYADSSAFDDETGKVRINCGLLAGLVWAGVSPETFDGAPSEFNGTLKKAFNWGFQFKYPFRAAHEVTNGDKTYGMIKPNESDYVGASSYNSYYSPNSPRADKQWFFSFATCADMACEMYVKGYEVPLRELEVGDLLFYACRSLVDGDDDHSESFRFRNITHVAIVTYVNRNTGSISVTESTSLYGSAYPIATCGPGYTDPVNKLRGIYLENKIVMAARHPAAFGLSSNLGTKFDVI